MYWYPLYAFLRRGGSAEDEAMDLVQGFVARLLEKGDVKADPGRGRFRAYVLGALQHYQANVRRADRAASRGGGRERASLDLDGAAARYAAESVDAASPQALFERRWALAILDRALARLDDEYRERGRGRLFAALRVTLTSTHTGETYAEKALALGVSESAIKVAVHRLRRRMGELVRDEIAQTVATPADVEQELQHLFEALAP